MGPLDRRPQPSEVGIDDLLVVADFRHRPFGQHLALRPSRSPSRSTRSTEPSSCSTISMVRPRPGAAAGAPRWPQPQGRVHPGHGSSSSSILGWAISARMISTSRRWPPLSSPGVLVRGCVKPNSASSADAGATSSRCRAASAVGQAESAEVSSPGAGRAPRPAGSPARSAARTRSIAGRCGSRRAGPPGVRRPRPCPTRRRPPARRSALRAPAISFRTVDLPAPFGPIRPVASRA